MITHCEFHPNDSQMFLYSSSKGSFTVCDLRLNSQVQSNCAKFETVDEEARKNYFSEIINSLSWATFSSKDHEIVSRDYMNVKVWDISNPGNEPLHNSCVLDFQNSHLQGMYDSGAIFDRFDVKVSSNGNQIMAGGYNDSFTVIDVS